MGLFASMFGSTSDAERMILETYPPMLQSMMGVSRAEAEQMTKGMINTCKEEATQERTNKLPPNFGDSLLKREATEPRVAAMLAEKRNQGVTDTDIRWWYNLHDLERRMMLLMDNMSRMAMFMKLCESGVPKENAAFQVKKAFPIFGPLVPDSADDAPLPCELKDRVNVMIEKYASAGNAQAYKSEVESYPSFNAFVRAKMRAGAL